MPRRAKSVGISHVNPEIIAGAKAKAKRLHMSFSGYVISLIERDLKALAAGDDQFSSDPAKVAAVGKEAAKVLLGKVQKKSGPPKDKTNGLTGDVPPRSNP